MKLTGGPGLSAGERGEVGENWPAGPRPRKEKRGCGGELGRKAKRRRGEEGFAHFFFKPIFQHIFQLNLLIKLTFCFFKTIITIKMHQYVCIKKCFLT